MQTTLLHPHLRFWCAVCDVEEKESGCLTWFPGCWFNLKELRRHSVRDCFPLQRGLNFQDIRICFKLLGRKVKKRSLDCTIQSFIIRYWASGNVGTRWYVYSPKEGRELRVNPQVSSTLVQGMVRAVSHAHSIFPQGQSCADRGTFFLPSPSNAR